MTTIYLLARYDEERGCELIDTDLGVYTSEEAARAKADRLNAPLIERYLKSHRAMHTMRHQEAIEHNALVKAGLRTGSLRPVPDYVEPKVRSWIEGYISIETAELHSEEDQ